MLWVRGRQPTKKLTKPLNTEIPNQEREKQKKKKKKKKSVSSWCLMGERRYWEEDKGLRWWLEWSGVNPSKDDSTWGCQKPTEEAPQKSTGIWSLH